MSVFVVRLRSTVDGLHDEELLMMHFSMVLFRNLFQGEQRGRGVGTATYQGGDVGRSRNEGGGGNHATSDR